MTALLDALARTFVAPAPPVAAQAQSMAAAPSAVVCGPAAVPLACALALLVRRRGPVVVCVWGIAPRRGATPGTAGARRIAASLVARGLSAHAGGRLVTVVLDESPTVAAAEAARAGAATGEAPIVVALCGPRDPAFDELLATQDLAVIASGDAPEGLTRLGLATLSDGGRHAVAAPSLSPAAAWVARCGLYATPTARRALAEATDALR